APSRPRSRAPCEEWRLSRRSHHVPRTAAVRIVGGAGAFRRYHRRAERIRRATAAAEGRAIVRLLEPAQDLTTDALGGLVRFQCPDVEPPLGVEISQLPAQAQARFRDRANAAPLAVAHLERGPDQLLRRHVPGTTDDAGILVLDS